MTNQATGASQHDIGRQAIVKGFSGTGTVSRVIGRTVEIELPYGKVSADQDNVIVK